MKLSIIDDVLYKGHIFYKNLSINKNFCKEFRRLLYVFLYTFLLVLTKLSITKKMFDMKLSIIENFVYKPSNSLID